MRNYNAKIIWEDVKFIIGVATGMFIIGALVALCVGAMIFGFQAITYLLKGLV